MNSWFRFFDVTNRLNTLQFWTKIPQFSLCDAVRNFPDARFLRVNHPSGSAIPLNHVCTSFFIWHFWKTSSFLLFILLLSIMTLVPASILSFLSPKTSTWLVEACTGYSISKWGFCEFLNYAFAMDINVRFISYSKCSNWRWISKLLSNFGCLFTFNSIKTDIHICNLWNASLWATSL